MSGGLVEIDDVRVPTIVGHYLVQSVPAVHGFIVNDIGDSADQVEVSPGSLSAEVTAPIRRLGIL
jgi:hypothetical protein